METAILAQLDYTTICSYPTYEEWKPKEGTICLSSLLSVLILPMRNGNEFVSPQLIVSLILGSYPTYEEWKQ